MKDNTIVYCQWYDDCVLQLMLNNALLIQIQVNISTGDVCKITFDKYLIGKLLEHISDGNCILLYDLHLYVYSKSCRHFIIYIYSDNHKKLYSLHL